MIRAAERNPEIDLAKIMAEQAAIRQAGFVALEREEAEDENNNHLDDSQAAEMESAEISFDDEKIERLKAEMDVAEQALESKRTKLVGHRNGFVNILPKKNHELGHFGRELADLEREYNEAKARYEEAAKITTADVAEISMDDIEIMPTHNNDEIIGIETKMSVEHETAEREGFIEKSRSHFREILNASNDIFDMYPELKGISKAEAIRMNNDLSDYQFVKERKVALKTLERLQDEYGKLYKESWMALFDNNLDAEILNMDAVEYVASHEEDKIVKILNILNSDDSSFVMIDPMPDETVAVWSRRLLSFMLKGK